MINCTRILLLTVTFSLPAYIDAGTTQKNKSNEGSESAQSSSTHIQNVKPNTGAKASKNATNASSLKKAIKNQSVKSAPATSKQLQKKFKHAGDFGVSGNYSQANAKKFNQAIQSHMNAPGTKQISGTYRGKSVNFHTNPTSGLTVIQNPNGSFLSGWKLNSQQLKHVLKDRKL